jgi:hypothetical protein
MNSQGLFKGHILRQKKRERKAEKKRQVKKKQFKKERKKFSHRSLFSLFVGHEIFE